MNTSKLNCILFAALQQNLVYMELLNEKGKSKEKKKNLQLYEQYLLDIYNHLGKKTKGIIKDKFEAYLSEYNDSIKILHETYTVNNLVVVISMVEKYMEVYNNHIDDILFNHKLKLLFEVFRNELEVTIVRDSKWAGDNLYKLLNNEEQISYEYRLERVKLWKK